MLCILAIVLALAGIFPHAVSSVTELIRALRGIPVVSNASANQPEKADPKGGDQDHGGGGVHAVDDLSLPVPKASP